MDHDCFFVEIIGLAADPEYRRNLYRLFLFDGRQSSGEPERPVAPFGGLCLITCLLSARSVCGSWDDTGCGSDRIFDGICKTSHGIWYGKREQIIAWASGRMAADGNPSQFPVQVSFCAIFAFHDWMDLGSHACIFVYTHPIVCHSLRLRDFSNHCLEIVMSRFSRRDFLKTSAAVVASATLAGTSRILPFPHSQTIAKPNILIFVFDAMSARHLSLYGYPRQTTPNLEKFAERASVYHNHYSAGNFTTSGTASMLTGLYPWTHRAINYRGMIDRSLVDRNFFHLIGNEYTRLVFTQNLWADILLSQFEKDLDLHIPCDSYSQFADSLMQPKDLPADRDLAYFVFQDFLNLRVDDEHPYPGSLSLASADLARALASERPYVSVDYPRGLPTNHDFSYENTSVLAGVERLVRDRLLQSSPYLGYFHFWSPHEPYSARKDFVGIFPEDLKLQDKPRHPFAASDFSEQSLRKYRREYDEFITDVDAEFGKLISNLETSGALENSYVIVTADHGELFERGEQGHASALMYAPVTHIPLLISAPGQTARSDFHSLTSNLDILPTLLQMADREVPDWVEGRLLPGFGGAEDANASRSIFPLMAKDNAAFRPIKRATFTLIKGAYELFFFTGYPDHPDTFELYNLHEDPQELHDLYSRDISTASHMKDELLEAIDTANRMTQKK